MLTHLKWSFIFLLLWWGIQDYVQHLVREAYQQWDNLREADELNANVALIQSKKKKKSISFDKLIAFSSPFPLL